MLQIVAALGNLTVVELKVLDKRRGVTQRGLKADKVQKIGDKIRSNLYGEAPMGVSAGDASSARSASATTTTGSRRAKARKKAKATPLERGEEVTDPTFRPLFVIENSNGKARWTNCADCHETMRYQLDREGLWVKDGWNPSRSQVTTLKEGSARRNPHFTGIPDRVRKLCIAPEAQNLAEKLRGRGRHQLLRSTRPCDFGQRLPTQRGWQAVAR